MCMLCSEMASWKNGCVGSTTDMGHLLNGQDEPSEPREVQLQALAASKLERLGGKTDVSGSIVHMAYLLNA